MDAFIESVHLRLAEDRKLIETIIKQRMALVSQEQVVGERIRAYEILVRDEKAANEPQGFAVLEKEGPVGTTIVPTSAVRFITDFISGRNGQGVTHKEIREALAAAGLKTHKNYPYVVVSNLKESGRVTEKKGKLVWVNAVDEKSG